jgi:hypothetical protein
MFHHHYYNAITRVKCSLSRSDGDSNRFLTSWWFIPHTNHTHLLKWSTSHQWHFPGRHRDEDIARMESRTTPIQEGEDDKDIATLDTSTLWSSLSCNSTPTQLPCHPRIQQTRRHCFGHNSIIRHQNKAFLDALERGRRRRCFGYGPSSIRSVDHSMWPRQGAVSPIWANLAMYRVRP